MLILIALCSSHLAYFKQLYPLLLQSCFSMPHIPFFFCTDKPEIRPLRGEELQLFPLAKVVDFV